MKRISKIFNFFILLSLFSCNNDKEVEITDRSQLSFDDIKQSTYTATGTLPSNKTISWNGELYPIDDETGLYYAISNWANTENISKLANLTYPYLCLNYIDGKLVLDDYTKIGEDGDYDLYFGASYLSGSSWEAVQEYTVSYNKMTKTLDFSGTNNDYQVYVGIFGKHYVTGEEIIYTDTQVKGVKLILTTKR